MPERTTIVMPLGLKQRAVAKARRQNISFGEFVRRAVESQLVAPAKRGRRKKTGDSYLDNLKTFVDDGPPDLSARIDEFLYGDHQ